MSVVDINDGDDEDEAEYFKRCNTQELNGMYLNSAREGDWPRIERLLAAGAELNYAGGGTLTAAIDGGHIDIAKKLIAKGIDTSRSKQEALNDAVFAGREDCVRYLIDEVGADPSFSDSAVLFTSVVNNRPGVTALLLEKGASPRAHKEALLGIALSHGYEDVAEALLDAGADPRKTYQDMNAYQWAAQEGLHAFQEKLRDCATTDVYMSPGFFKRQTLDELRGIYDERQKQSGLYLAALAGCFDIVVEKILSTPGAKLSPDDLTHREQGGRTVLLALADDGKLALAFDPRLWLGRKEQALAVLEKDVPASLREQVDAPHLAAEIDRLTLKNRAGGTKLKLKPPRL
jgi:hypothetical protein